MKRRTFLQAATAGAALWNCPIEVLAEELRWKNWTSKEVNEAFALFAKTKKMPKDLHAWLGDQDIQKIIKLLIMCISSVFDGYLPGSLKPLQALC